MVIETEIPKFLIDHALEVIDNKKILERLTADNWGDNVQTSFTHATCILKHLNLTDIIRYIDIKVKEYTDLYPTLQHDYKLTDSWINVTRYGGFQNSHVHQLDGISGVFYLKTTGSKEGVLGFSAPFQYNHVMNNYFITPAVGNLIIFHGSFSHFVTFNKTDQPRISLSFNYGR